MADIEACGPTEELVSSMYASQRGKDSKADLILSPSEISGETDTMTSEHREPTMSKSAPVSDLENTAEEILKYTGLSGKRLKRRMEEFKRCNRGIIVFL